MAGDSRGEESAGRLPSANVQSGSGVQVGNHNTQLNIITSQADVSWPVGNTVSPSAGLEPPAAASGAD